MLAASPWVLTRPVRPSAVAAPAQEEPPPRPDPRRERIGHRLASERDGLQDPLEDAPRFLRSCSVCAIGAVAQLTPLIGTVHDPLRSVASGRSGRWPSTALRFSPSTTPFGHAASGRSGRWPSTALRFSSSTTPFGQGEDVRAAEPCEGVSRLRGVGHPGRVEDDRPGRTRLDECP